MKTFEYDLALSAKNRTAMLAALKLIHPDIGADLEAKVTAEGSEADKAKTLFKGMFEREVGTNIQKGKFGQALAEILADATVEFDVPSYVTLALKHAASTIV
ncbi:MAG: hypothetical protein IPO17_10425 [Flavobacteriales bacterium]|nr:hypothetical protein [Flavobacteriales bacterium]